MNTRLENTVKNITVKPGRKPALPPKPPKRLEMKGKSTEFVHNTSSAILELRSTPTKQDPAEMTLKERLALFEKKNIALESPTNLKKRNEDFGKDSLENSAEKTLSQLDNFVGMQLISRSSSPKLPPPPAKTSITEEKGDVLYGDLTRIVTTIAPKQKSTETIGLNDLLGEPNCTLLDEQNQTKDEDKWDKIIECLLFFCCVA